MSRAWEPRAGTRDKVNPDNCRASIWSRIGFHQCTHKGRLEHDGMKWCGHHHPPTVQAKNEEKARLQKMAADFREKMNGEWALERRMERAALEAIRKIAAGHNDPQTLARQILAAERVAKPPGSRQEFLKFIEDQTAKRKKQ